MTIDELALKLGVDQTVAYGFIRFLEEKRWATTVGAKKEPGARGKGKKIYALKAEAAKELSVSSLAVLPE
jgi:hypothetical protein